MAQTDLDTYGFELDRAQAGQQADAGFDHVESFAAEGTVPFGYGVVAGTADNQVEVAGDDGDDFVGISLFCHTRPQGIDQSAAKGEQFSTGAEYRDGDTVNVLRRGRVYVTVTANVSAGDDAYVDVLTSGEEGQFTNVSTDNLAINGIFRTSADSGELAVVEVNLP